MSGHPQSTALPAAGARAGGEGQALHHRDPFAAKLGMWLFLFTELLLFGGLFLLYAVYRTRFPRDFHFAATTLDPLVGAANTLVLLTSSLTMVLSIAALERGRWRASLGFLITTIALGAVFLVNKGFEWSAKIGHGLYPRSAHLLDHTDGENLFYGLYYGMTGLHAVHVVVGMAILAAMAVLMARAARAARGAPGCREAPASHGDREATGPAEREVGFALLRGRGIQLENAGLYWHLVDIIWIFLFPLFYLIS